MDTSEKEKGRDGHKPGSVPEDQVVIIHLGRRLPAASCDRPGGLGRAALWRLPIWSCSGWGLPSLRCHHRSWWALASPFHPYRALHAAVCFLLHFPWGRPRSVLRTTLPCGARTFLPGV